MTTRILSLAIGVCAILSGVQSDITAVAADAGPRPVLWKDPGTISSRDLFWGGGSPEQAPQPPFTFIKEDTGGTKPKVHVKDARGVTWTVKFPGEEASHNEVHAEIAAARLTWALGYFVEEMYFVPEGRVEGATNLKRAAAHLGPDGTFRTARFEKRPPHIVRTDRRWTFDRNPFVGTKELSGLKILTTALSNWDASAANSEILRVTGDAGVEDWYVLTDLGSTFGQMGLPSSLSRHTRWNLTDYRDQKVVDRAGRDVVRLRYQGAAAIRDVPTAHARWFSQQAAQLTPEQVRQAFKSAGASEEDVAAFSATFVSKISQLQAALNDVE